jgi:hypothetical protein
MKKYITYAIDSGLVIGFMETTDPVEIVDGIFAIEDSFEFDTSKTYVFDTTSKTVMPTPEKPSPHHDWDWATKSWLPNLDAARASKLQQVSAELNTRLYLPCNGFDADKVSRERISGMIARLQRGDGLPAGWLGWRDANNDMQWAADDAATVLASLTALSLAIENREQALLVASWTHKANISALDDIDAILAYDVTAAW